MVHSVLHLLLWSVQVNIMKSLWGSMEQCGSGDMMTKNIATHFLLSSSHTIHSATGKAHLLRQVAGIRLSSLQQGCFGHCERVEIDA